MPLTGTVSGPSQIIHHNFGASFGQLQRIYAAQTRACSVTMATRFVEPNALPPGSLLHLLRAEPFTTPRSMTTSRSRC